MAKEYNDYYTYAYLREDKTPYYIGKGRGKRIYDKRRTIKAPTDKSRILFLKKNLTEAEAFKHEIYMIAIFGRKDLGTGILRNLTNGGDGPSGAVRSVETKKKLSEAHLGKTHTEEQKKARSERMSGENNPMYGVPRTEETKKKISQAKSGEKHPQYGRTGALHHNSKAIIAIEPDGTKQYFGGISEAARKLKIPRNNLSNYLGKGHVLTKGPRKDWQFLYENP